MDIILTKTIDLDKFHYENIGRNYKSNKVFLECSNPIDAFATQPCMQMLTDIGQLLAYEQGARFIQSLDIPKDNRIITLIADDYSETYRGRYQSNRMTISPHTMRLHEYCRGYKRPELNSFYFDIEPADDKSWDIQRYCHFMFQIQKDDMNKVHAVYQKPLLQFGRGSLMDAKTAEALRKILTYADTPETKAELRQEIFHQYDEVMQLVVEGDFTRLKNDKQKNKMMKTIENLENKIIEMGEIGVKGW